MISILAAAALAGGATDAPAEIQLVPGPSTPTWENLTSYRDIGFVPRGWRLFDKAEGDLNGDGRTDSVLIIQENDPAKMRRNLDGFGMDYHDANPRIVLVILQDSLGQYRLVAKGNAIIPDHDQPTISDPYEDMRIEDGSLHLHIAFFANAGSWSMSNRRFQFRWDGEAMALIGYDVTHVRRNTGEMRQTSVNYLTGRRKDASGNIEDDESNWVWSDVPKGTQTTLSTIGDGFEFEG